MKPSFRMILFGIVGLIDALLMLWDVHNQHVILSMGMAWDTGAPVWPYQAANILFFALNTPAFLLATPFANLLNLQIPTNYMVLFPSALAWWWFFGWLIDRWRYASLIRPRWSKLALSLIVTTLLGLIIVMELRTTFSWWFTYAKGINTSDSLVLLRFTAPVVWCFIFSLFTVSYAKRVIKANRR